ELRTGTPGVRQPAVGSAVRNGARRESAGGNAGDRVVTEPARSGPGGDIAVAYAQCERIAREHYENFPVASSLLPPAMRPHIAAIYAFARRADDFADDPGPSSEDRLRLLHSWASRIARGVPTRH